MYVFETNPSYRLHLFCPQYIQQLKATEWQQFLSKSCVVEFSARSHSSIKSYHGPMEKSLSIKKLSLFEHLHIDSWARHTDWMTLDEEKWRKKRGFDRTVNLGSKRDPLFSLVDNNCTRYQLNISFSCPIIGIVYKVR